MYKLFRNFFGCTLLSGAILMLTGFCSFPEKQSFTYASGMIPQYTINHLPSLDRSDVFNNGNSLELSKLPGIGESISALVAVERERNGIYYYPEDIVAVKGIGLKKLEQLRPYMQTDLGESEE